MPERKYLDNIKVFTEAKQTLYNSTATYLQEYLREHFTPNCDREIGYYDTYNGTYEYEASFDGTFEEFITYVGTLKDVYDRYNGNSAFQMPLIVKAYERTEDRLAEYNNQETDTDYNELEIAYDGYKLTWWEMIG